MIRSTCSLGILIVGLMAPTVLGDFTDTFTSGINTNDWSLQESTAGLYSAGTSSDGVDFARIGANPTGTQYVRLALNLSAVSGANSITGDFSTSISFSNANLTGPSIDSAELQTHYSDGVGFDVSRSDEDGQEVHVWNGSINGLTPVYTSYGTLSVTRVGSTVSGYYDGSLIYSMTETNPMDYLDFVLQNTTGNDPISISFTNFDLAAPGVVPEPASILSLTVGIGLFALATKFWNQKKKAF